MKYYSTNHQAPEASLREAVIKGLALDKGLYMPFSIPTLPKMFFEQIDKMSFQEIAFEVALSLLGEDVESEVLHTIVYDTLKFDVPAVKVTDRMYALELFHGPTLAFKDVGARFMARLLRHFVHTDAKGTINVLVATSGDTGSAVANGFLGVKGIHVYVLYPNEKVSQLQEMQFTTLGQNITAIAVNGTFDDCQNLVKMAFMDGELNNRMKLTSANSINLARLLPQSFYYFYAYAQMKRIRLANRLVVCVPSGNFGNLAAGLIAWKMGLPIHRFIAANNRNDVFFKYLQSGHYEPRSSVATIANAMDVGAPSNFARILALFDNDYHAIKSLISGASYTDEEIKKTIQTAFGEHHYLLDPHGACAYQALTDHLRADETGLFLETAHPAKFRDTISAIIGQEPEIPVRLQAFMNGKKECLYLDNNFEQLKSFLLNELVRA